MHAASLSLYQHMLLAQFWLIHHCHKVTVLEKSTHILYKSEIYKIDYLMTEHEHNEYHLLKDRGVILYLLCPSIILRMSFRNSDKNFLRTFLTARPTVLELSTHINNGFSGLMYRVILKSSYWCFIFITVFLHFSFFPNPKHY